MAMTRQNWLDRLPAMIRQIEEEWSLEIGPPYCGADSTVSWVAPVRRRNGTRAVLKIAMPHMEAEQEADGLRFWAGDPTVRLLEAEPSQGALLLESCEPGTSLRALPEPEQDEIVATLLKRVWRRPPTPLQFRSLQTMIAHWTEETIHAATQWPDHGVVREGLALFKQLSAPSDDDALLATDLHAGNVLAAKREAWLVIDPKPFFGDRAYDATQHLMNCKARLLAAPRATIDRMSDLLELRAERVRSWMFARAAAEPRARWDQESMRMARALA
jgi:streptomycin 6-kinase